jgi:hypothetical protein
MQIVLNLEDAIAKYKEENPPADFPLLFQATLLNRDKKILYFHFNSNGMFLAFGINLHLPKHTENIVNFKNKSGTLFA